MDKKEARNLKRIEKSKINTTVALFTNIIMGVLSFVERTVFNHFFTEDYLGLYSFNNNIIGILTLFELGLASAVAYALYAPLEYNNKEQITAIMKFFRNAYFIIGSLILSSGLILLPILPRIIKTTVDISHVQIYFVLFLIGNVSSYYINYKNILFNANQEQYKVTMVTNISWTLLYLVEILIAVFTQSFLLYSIAIMIANLIKNIVLNILAKREYPYLSFKNKSIKLDSSIKNKIIKNTKGLILTRVGIAMVSCTDSMLISALVGTATLGKYSNYQIIYLGLLTLAILLPQNITASIGNAGVTESKRTMSRGFAILDLSSFFIYSAFAIMLLNVVNPIVSTFFGANRTLPLSTVAIICVNFYFQAMRELILSYKSSLGLYWEDRKRPLIEGITNLITSIVFGYFWGLNGILIGTMITSIFVNFMLEPVVIFHYGFTRSAYGFYFSNTLRFILVIIIAISTYYINAKINISSYINATLSIGTFKLNLGSFVEIIFNAIVSLAITNGIYLLIFRKTESAAIIKKTLMKRK
ncbi:lipopolysaccharide biosynthesis protein [Bullifex porci]|uniref:lipopolysaccharide biosynthesis protein n=1 Tax=Bullifex porci TaxID=2606638 RepID=UPI0023EFAA2D|nr:oligosaccharide flippase family protein [Bullifex porci]MDD7255380.1 hypothetical protein [Bullifex porci]MDY2740227.1 hypothetical protein [Bullifex porci]